MNHLQILFLGLIAALSAISVLPLLAEPLRQRLVRHQRQRAEDLKGAFVAEVWLDWDICRGSTMFRGRFATKERAVRQARRHAEILDVLLPKTYAAEYQSGRRYHETYDFSISWGVRPLTTAERANGVHDIWATEMPGSSRFKGEHAMAHPLQNISSGEEPLLGSVAGFRT